MSTNNAPVVMAGAEYAPGVVKVGGEFLMAQPLYEQELPALTALNGGGFVATWQDDSHELGDLFGWGIAAQIFNADGTKVGEEFLVNTQTIRGQDHPQVSALRASPGKS